MTAPQTKCAKDQLKSIIERVERLEEEKKAIADDIREVYAEAKANGFDVKALRTIVRMRKQDADRRKEEEAVLETYMHALGMLFDPDVDLGRQPRPQSDTARRSQASASATPQPP